MIEFFTYILRRTKNACWTLFKFMIPISILVRLIQEWDLLTYCSAYLSPIMGIAGLPAEMGLVWLTSMVVNIYGGLLCFFGIYPALGEPMTVAQMTTLLTMILVAHTFPIELSISQKTGVKTSVMFIIRFGFAILLGFLMAKMYHLFDYLQEPLKITPVFNTTQRTWGAWALNEVKNYAVITGIIFTLIVVLRLLQVTGIIRMLNRLMQPALGWLGIGSGMLPLTVIGLTMGIAYGGALMIEECQGSGVATMKPKEIFYSMTLMGLFHSIIEDTLLILSMGGHWTGVVVFRALFAFVITYIIVKLTRNIDEKYFLKYVMTKAYRRRYLNK